MVDDCGMSVDSSVEMSVKAGTRVDGFCVNTDEDSCVEDEIKEVTIFVVDCSCSVVTGLDSSVENEERVVDSIDIVDDKRDEDAGTEISVVCLCFMVDNTPSTEVVASNCVEDNGPSVVVSIITVEEYGKVVSSVVTTEERETTVISSESEDVRGNVVGSDDAALDV